MAYTRGLLDQVRVTGRIGLPPGRHVRNCLPIIYTGESKSGVPYHTSGGRSLLFEEDDGIYKAGGVDPYGHLTRRVASSPKNRLHDVRHADRSSQRQSKKKHKSFWGKPFGVFTRENVEHAQEAFSRLNGIYRADGIVPPCELVDFRRIEEHADAYQLLFRLPSLESDLRVIELLELIESRLENAPQEELERKLVAVNRLCGRLAGWTGYAMETLARNRLVPTESSWAMQNMVLHHIGNGYGAFRVDHTSTKYDDSEALDKFYAWVNRNFDDIDFPAVRFSFLTEAVQVGARYPEIADRRPHRERTPFRRVLDYYKSTEQPQKALVDVTPIIDTHRRIFHMGRGCVGNPNAAHGLAIPEDYLTTIFE